MKGFLVSYFSLPSSIVHSESEEGGRGHFFDKSSMVANSCSTGEMDLSLFHRRLLYFSIKIELLAFSSGVGLVTCAAHPS